jgi:hypothetical protein
MCNPRNWASIGPDAGDARADHPAMKLRFKPTTWRILGVIANWIAVIAGLIGDVRIHISCSS